MNLPIVVVANVQEKKLAAKMFKKYEIKVIGEGFYQVLVNLKGISKKQPLINFGMAGGAGFNVGEVVEVGCSKLLNVIYPIKCKTYKLSNSKAICYTNNDFVLKNDTKDKKCLFDMELYYILAFGYNVIRSVKVVSDNLDLKKYQKNKAKC